MRRKQARGTEHREPKTCLRRRCVSLGRSREDESERKKTREGGLVGRVVALRVGVRYEIHPWGHLHARVLHKEWSHRLTPGNRADELGSWLVGKGSERLPNLLASEGIQHPASTWGFSVRRRLVAYHAARERERRGGGTLKGSVTSRPMPI